MHPRLCASPGPDPGKRINVIHPDPFACLLLHSQVHPVLLTPLHLFWYVPSDRERSFTRLPRAIVSVCAGATDQVLGMRSRNIPNMHEAICTVQGEGVAPAAAPAKAARFVSGPVAETGGASEDGNAPPATAATAAQETAAAAATARAAATGDAPKKSKPGSLGARGL